ncbi:MAG: hypothetical protein LBT53_05375 [Puniceicoccales bacterium]|jgi:hypothetical protein|nr:hypothetical protein [Puniceicoccales bacterium]
MKKFFLILGAFCALVTTGCEAPLNTQGIPADAVGIFHADIEALNKTESFKVAGKNGILQRIAESFGSERKNKKLKKDTGFDPWVSLLDVTVGFLPPEVKKSSSGKIESPRRGPPEATIIVARGTFAPEKIRAYIANEQGKKNVKTHTIGKHEFIEVNREILGSRGFLLFIDAKTAVFVLGNKSDSWLSSSRSKEILKTVADTLDGKAKAYVPPASLTAFAAQTGTPVALLYFDLAQFQIPKLQFPALPTKVHFALGNDSGTLKLRGIADFASEESLAGALVPIHGGLGFLRAELAQNHARATKNLDDYSERRKKEAVTDLKLYREVSELLSSVIIGNEEKAATLRVDYSDASLVNLANTLGLLLPKAKANDDDDD